MMNPAEYEPPEVVAETSSRSSDTSLDAHITSAHDVLKSLKQECVDDGDVEVQNRIDLSLPLIEMLIPKPNSSSANHNTQPTSSHSPHTMQGEREAASSPSSRWTKQETEDSAPVPSMPRRQMPALPAELMHSPAFLSRLLDGLLSDPRGFDALARFIDIKKQKHMFHNNDYTIPTLQTKVEDGIVTSVIFFYEDDPLPRWNREVYLRLHGKTAGKNDIRYASLDLDRRFRTRPELQQTLQKRSVPQKEQSLFDFSAPFCVCQRPSDHNNKLDTFIECSFGRCGCNAWIHPQCVGLGRLSSKQVSSLKRVVCPFCVATLSASSQLEEYFPSTHYLHLKHLTMGYKRVVFKQEDDSLIEASNLWPVRWGLSGGGGQSGGGDQQYCYEVKDDEYDYSSIWQRKEYPDRITNLLLPTVATSSSSGSSARPSQQHQQGVLPSSSVISSSSRHVTSSRGKDSSSKEDSSSSGRPHHRLIQLLADNNDDDDAAMNTTTPSRKRSSSSTASNPALHNNRQKRNRPTPEDKVDYSPPKLDFFSHSKHAISDEDYDANFDFEVEYPEFATRRRLFVTHPNRLTCPTNIKLKLGVTGGYMEEQAVASRVTSTIKRSHRAGGGQAVVRDWGQGDVLVESAMRLALPPRSRSTPTTTPSHTTQDAAAIPLLLLPQRDGVLRTIPAWASHPKRLDLPSTAGCCMLCLRGNTSGVHVLRTVTDSSTGGEEEVAMHVQCAMILDKQQWLSDEMSQRLDGKVIAHGLFTGASNSRSSGEEDKVQLQAAEEKNDDNDDNENNEEAMEVDAANDAEGEDKKKPSRSAAAITNKQDPQQHRCLLCCREGGIKLSISFSSSVLAGSEEEREGCLHVPCLLQLAMMSSLLNPITPITTRTTASTTNAADEACKKRPRLSTSSANATAADNDDDEDDEDSNNTGNKMDMEEEEEALPVTGTITKEQANDKAKSLLEQQLHHNGRCSVCEGHRGLVLRCGAIGCHVRAHLMCLALQQQPPSQSEGVVTMMGEVGGMVCMLCSVHATSNHA